MELEAIVGAIIMLTVCWGCGALFYGIGIWAQKKATPMHFWAGTKIDPDTLSDIPAYNRENAIMWKLYSIPYWLAGLLGIFCVFRSWLIVLSLVCLVLAGTVGLWWLIKRYKKISSKYIKRESA